MKLDRSFYTRDDVCLIAKELLGQFLCVENGGLVFKAMIVETEAYKGPEDKASHAYNNRRTKRTSTMFKTGGTSYVYLCYGIHQMMNVVTSNEEQPHAILLRAAQPMNHIPILADQFKSRKKSALLLSGPGNLCKGLRITKEYNNLDLVNSNKIWIESIQNSKSSVFSIVESPRVGIAYAKEYANEPWRFRIKDHPSVSKPHEVKYPNYE